MQGKDGYYYSFLMAIPTKNWTPLQGLLRLPHTHAGRSNELARVGRQRLQPAHDQSLRHRVTSAPVCAFLATDS